MSSILSFAWRRQQNNVKRDGSDVGSERKLEDGALHVDTNDHTTHNSIILIPRPNEVVTPEGFKERRSMIDIKNVLFHGNDEKRSPKTKHVGYYDDFQDLVDETEIDSTTEEPKEKVFLKQDLKMETLPIIPRGKTYLTDNQNEDRFHYAAKNIEKKDSFPVLPPLPLRSWSTEGDAVASPGTLLLSSRSGTSQWPQSTSSWGGSANLTISSPLQAESPQLELGRARTAVGNLLVSLQQQQQDPPGMTPLQNVSYRFSSTDISKSRSPRGKNVDSVRSPMIKRQSVPNSQSSELSLGSSNRSMNHKLPAIAEQPSNLDNKKHRSTREAIDTDSRMFSPLTSKSHISHDDSNVTQLDIPVPMLYVNPDVPIPPIGNPTYTPTTSFLLMHQRLLDLEKQSKATRQFQEQVIVEKKQSDGFCWTVTSSTNNSHSSGHSTGSKASKRTITSDSNSIVLLDQAIPNHSILDSSQFSDQSIQRNKARSQRRMHEDLIVSALERLHDNIQLISEVEGLIKLDRGALEGTTNSDDMATGSQHQSMYDWFMPTSYNVEGILTGFTETKRYLILDRIDLFLNDFVNELDNDYDSSNVFIQNVQEALSFCKVLVQMSIPEIEKEDSSLQGTDEIGRWQFRSGMREVIGLLTSKSTGTPRRGECDFSLFSLPEEENENCDTPMTSNLSIGASTLTTLVKDYDFKQDGGTTLRHTFGTSIAMKQQPHLQLQYNGLYLRQAIQMFTTGIQKMTLACNLLSQVKSDLLTLSSFIDFANRIREAYLQLLSLSQHDLKSIVDAFEFELDTETAFADQFDEGICEIIDDDESIHELQESKTIESPIVHAETLGFGVLENTVTSLIVSASEQSPQLHSPMAPIHPVKETDRLIEKFDSTSIDDKTETSDEEPKHDHNQENHPVDIWRMKSVDSDDDDDNCSFVSLFVVRYRNLDTGSRLEV